MRLDLPVNGSSDTAALEQLPIWFSGYHSSLLQVGVFSAGANFLIGAAQHASFVMMEAPMKAMYTAVILGVSVVIITAVKSWHVHVEDEEETKYREAAQASDKVVVQENAQEAAKEEEEEIKHPLAFMAFGRVKDHTVLAQYEGPDAEEKVVEEFHETFEKLMKAAKKGRVQHGQRNVFKEKDTFANCRVFYALDNEGQFMSALAVIDPVYLEKYAYGCLNEFMGEAHEKTREYDAEHCGKNGLDQLMDTQMGELFEKFKAPETHTVYGQTLNKFTMVKAEINSSAAVVSETGDSLTALEESTHSMDVFAREFNEHAETAKWKHQVERYKMYITYGTIAFDVASLSILWLVL